MMLGAVSWASQSAGDVALGAPAVTAATSPGMSLWVMAAVGVQPRLSPGMHRRLLAIVARDRGEVPFVFQCLIYPMLDDRTGTSRGPERGDGCGPDDAAGWHGRRRRPDHL